MQCIKIAHVKIYPTNNSVSRIEIFYENNKIIKVFLPLHYQFTQTQITRQSLIRDFTHAVQNYDVAEFEADDNVTQNNIRTLLAVCQQNNHAIYMMTNSGSHMSRPVQSNEYSRQPLLNRISSEHHNTNTNDLVDNNSTLQNLILRTVQLLSYPESVTHNNFHEGNNEAYRNQNTSHQNRVSELLNNIDLSPHPINPVIPRNINDPQPPPLINTQSPYVEFKSGENSIQTTHDIGDTNQPQRFIVNEHNRRDVLIQSNDTNNTPADDNETVNSEHIIQPLAHATSLSTNQRKPISAEIIKKLSVCVYKTIRTTSIKPPNFSNRSRTGYRKIKNFIHNLVKVWLSQDEINTFITEFNILSTAITDIVNSDIDN
jgi:hypothetical protein